MSALVAGATPEAAARDAARAVARGFRALKCKVGDPDPAVDEARVAAVRVAVGPGAELRLDANGAWSEGAARDALAKLARFEPAWVEQPVPAWNLGALARLRALGLVPIAADESAANEHGARRVLGSHAADLLVVKAAAAGGVRAAARIAVRARAAGVGVVVTSLLDSALGRAAALHLCATLPDPLSAAAWRRVPCSRPTSRPEASPSPAGCGCRRHRGSA